MMVPGGMDQLPPAPHGKHSHQHYQASLHQNNTGIQPPQQSFFTPEQDNQLIGMINKTTISEPSVNLAGNALVLHTTLDKPKWIVDTGATNHMIGNHNLLKHGSSVGNTGTVQLPNGDSAAVSQVGDYQLSEGALIKNVLCVP